MVNLDFWIFVCSHHFHSDIITIHGFTISVQVILPLFWQLLLRNGVNPCFWIKRTHRANSRLRQQSFFISILNNFSNIYIFKLVLYFDSTFASNQIKLYLTPSREDFLQTQYGFYRCAMQILYGLLLVEHLLRTQQSERLERGCLEHHVEKLSNLCDCIKLFE